MKKIIMAVSLALVLSVLLLVFLTNCTGARVSVSAATLPNSTSLTGEAVLFRFTVSVEDADTVIQSMTFSWEGPVEGLTLYDGITEIGGASIISSEGKFVFWPGWPPIGREEGLVIPKGVTKLLSVRGTILERSNVFFQLEDLTVKDGRVVGLPTAATSLTVNGQR